MIRWIEDDDGNRSLAAASPLHIDGINSVEYQPSPEFDADRNSILEELEKLKN
jgi:hypothetical protein